MHGLFLADLGRDWTLAASIETFAIPVGLFVVVAAILYFLYTRPPQSVPGHRDMVPAGTGARLAAGAGGTGAPTAGGQDAPAEGAEGTE